MENHAIVKFSVDPIKDKEKTILLSEYADNVKYVKLQTSERCMVSQVLKVLVDNDYIFVLSPYKEYSRLLVFSADGVFRNEIGTQGRGPGEFSTILDFALNKSDKIVYILDTMGNILIYDFSGRYFRTIKLNSRPSSLLFFEGALILFSAWPDYYLNRGYAIQVKHLSGNQNDMYLLNRKSIKQKREPGVIIYPNYFYGVNSNRTISFFESKFDTLYNIDSKYIVKPTLVIKMVNDLPRNLLTTNEYNIAKRTHNTKFGFIETQKYFFFTVITAKPHKTFFYILNKTSGESVKQHVTNTSSYMINDYDGGLGFKPQGLADENLMYSSVDSYALKDYLEKNNSQRIKIEDKSNIAHLRKLMMESTILDNPVLMFVKLK